MLNTVSPNQDNVKLVKKFDLWEYSKDGLAKRMPHIIQNYLTVQEKAKTWGSITGNLSFLSLIPNRLDCQLKKRNICILYHVGGGGLSLNPLVPLITSPPRFDRRWDRRRQFWVSTAGMIKVLTTRA